MVQPVSTVANPVLAREKPQRLAEPPSVVEAARGESLAEKHTVEVELVGQWQCGPPYGVQSTFRGMGVTPSLTFIQATYTLR